MRAALFIAALFLVLPIAAHAASVNINTADAALLDTLPGIGQAKAEAIIQYREEHGPFKAVEDIQNVSGIGPATFAHLKEQITVAAASVQPTKPAARYEQVQEVDTITSLETDKEPHDNEIEAPAVAQLPAAAGAVSAAPSRGTALLHSSWTLGLLGVVLIAAGGLFVLI